MIKVNELFSGIGAFRKALINLEAEHEVVGIAEIDKYAIKSYEAMYGAVHNYGDISKLLKLDYADMWTYGFPCQDISVAGKQAGIERHTRSGLLYQVQRLLEVAYQYDELPKYLILENVKNLVGKKFKAQFDEWLQYLDELGYNNYWQVLNAKNYGIPQNRERVFVVSIRKDIDKGYKFPEPFDNGLRLKDMLEDEVDEKYYLSDAMTKYVLDLNEVQKGTAWEGRANNDVLNPEIAHTLSVRGAGGSQRAGVSNFIADGVDGEIKVSELKTICLNPKGGRNGIEGLQPSLKDRVYDSEGVATAVTTSDFFMPSYKVSDSEIQKVTIPQTVSVRKNEVDTELLVMLLREHKAIKGITNRQISDALSKPITEVEHWFRTDSCFAIPDPAIWLELKELLGITTDGFDKPIMEFEERIGTYEKAERCYMSEGISPTLTSTSADEKVIHDYRIRKLTPKECFRLMGFSDSDFQKCVDAGISNSQLYKMAGNSICVDVLYYMMKNLLEEHHEI